MARRSKAENEKLAQFARQELIRRGQLDWMLHDGQKKLAAFFHTSDQKIIVLNCARRFGKSYWLVVEAIKFCLNNPNSQVRLAASTEKQIKSIFQPILDKILAHFPADCMPAHANKVWTFPNKSQLIIAGADYKEGDGLRGVESHLVLIDEAGFTKNLKYLVQDILLPQLLTTGGRLVMASTPPRTMAHDFVEYVNSAVPNNAYQKFTIYDNPMLTKKQIESVIRECGGVDTITFKREYLCELISDTEALIIREFQQDIHVKESPVPRYYQPYVGCDFGTKDFTAILFAYLDFERQTLVIQDEFVANYQTTEQIAKAIVDKEKALWKVDVEGKETWRGGQAPERIGDNELQILWDLQGIYKIPVKKVVKDYDKFVALSDLRVKFTYNKIEVSPKCKNLIHQLQNGTWNEKRTDFERTETTGHCDAIDALIYMSRYVKWTFNPIPSRIPDRNQEFVPKKPAFSENEAWAKALNLKRFANKR